VRQVQHRVTREAQPIADQWMLRCSCGWSCRVDLWDESLNTQAAIQQRIEFEVQKHLGVLVIHAVNMKGKVSRNDFGAMTFGWLPLLRAGEWAR
jgi:hypothetical protein